MFAKLWFWLLGKCSLMILMVMPQSMFNKQTVYRLIFYFFNRGWLKIAFQLVDYMVYRDENEDLYLYLRAQVFVRHMQLEDGFEDISSAIEISPRNTTYWMFRADIHKELGRFEEAIADLQQSIRYSRSTDHAPQYYEIGMNYLLLESYEQALQSLQKAVEDENVAIPAYYYRLAQVYDRMHDHETAQKWLEHSVALNFQIEEQIPAGQTTVYDRSSYTSPMITDFLIETYNLAMYVPTLCKFYFVSERWQEAYDYLTRTIQYLPEHDVLYLERSKCLRAMHRFDEAHADIEKALQNDEESPIVYTERAHLFRMMGNEERALQDFQKAKTLDEEHPFLDYWIAGSYVALDQLDEALHAFGEALKRDPSDVDCYLERAEIHESFADYDAAKMDYDEAITLRDDDETRVKRAQFFWRRDAFEDALIDLQHAIEHNSALIDDLQFRYVRGCLLMEIGNFTLALDDLQRAVDMEEDHEYLHERCARCLIELERNDEALAACNKGLSVNPDFPPLLWTRGFLLYQMSDYKGAVRDALDYLRLNPEDSSAHYNLALIYVNLFEYKNALAQLSLAIARDPYHVEAYYQRAHVWEKLLDFDRVATDLANWVFYSRGEHSVEKRVAQLRELDSFDEMIIDDAVTQLKKMYGQNGHALLH